MFHPGFDKTSTPEQNFAENLSRSSKVIMR